MKRIALTAALAFAFSLAGAVCATPTISPGEPIGAAAAVGREPPQDLVQPDPHVALGRLDNGLRYAIARTDGPPETTIDFYVGAGSKDETDAERGTAHFLEHMAFSGSKNFPSGSVLPKFEEIGVGLGRDQNAQTGFNDTTYSLDIADSTEAKVDLAFRWLGDVAHGLTIDPAEVDRERGTILSEYRESLNPATAVSDAAGKFFFPELLGSRRLPIGTQETIRAADGASIRAFYEKWYRPEDTILVIVTNEPVDAIVARINQTFGDWRGSVPAPRKPDLGRVNADRGLDAATIADANAANQLQICRAIEKDPVEVEGVAVHMRDLEDQIWSDVLSKRLNRLSQQANPPLATAGAGRQDLFETGSLGCVSIGVLNGDWRAALKAAAVESRRMDLYGITPGEMSEESAQLKAGLDAGLAGGNRMTQKARADLMLENFQLGGTIDSVEEDYRIVTRALGRLNVDLVNGEFHRVWTDANGPLIMLVGPTPVASDDVRKAWQADMAEPGPRAPVDDAPHTWAYQDFGPPGVVASREDLPDIAASRIQFANGVRVNFKRLDNMQDKVFIRVRFGAGQEELPAEDNFAGELGALMLRQGGLGKNDFQDTVRLCETHSCDFEFLAGRSSFLMQGSTRVADLDVQLQLLSAFLTDPGFRPELDAQLPTAINFAYRQLAIDPNAVASRAMQDALPRPHVADIPPKIEAEKIRSLEFRRLLGPPLKSDALEVTVVGDIDETVAETALAKTLGAIPARVREDRARPGAAHTRFPEAAPATIHVTHEGPSDQAAVLLAWPLFVWTPEKVHEQRTIEVLAAMLQDEIIDTIRRQMGKTYSPGVKVDLARGGDQGDLAIQLITAPQDAQAVADQTLKIVNQYAAGNLTPEALERARQPLVDGGQSRELTVGWWLDVLDGSWAHPDQIAAAQHWQQDYAGVTLDEVEAEARRWLTQKPMVVIAEPKGG